MTERNATRPSTAERKVPDRRARPNVERDRRAGHQRGRSAEHVEPDSIAVRCPTASWRGARSVVGIPLAARSRARALD